jgi:purine-binding chemotaxis protein CheW
MALKNSPKTQLVTFRLGRELYGINIFQIQEVLHYQPITAIPGAPVFLEGVIKLRDNVVPVVDLKKRLGMVETFQTKRRIIILDLKHSRLGLVVDDISKVFSVDESNLEPLPEAVVADSQKYCFSGLAKIENDLVIIIAPDKILSATENQDLAGFGPGLGEELNHAAPVR